MLPAGLPRVVAGSGARATVVGLDATLVTAHSKTVSATTPT